MNVRYLHSFDKTVHDLEERERTDTNNAVDALLSYFETGQRPQGLGLKKLRGHYWEIRAGIKIRILFSLEKDLLTFIVAGNHDTISRFLRNNAI